MKIIMTGGGTGGHIYPALAIAESLKNKYEDCEILFVGTKKGIESTLIPKYGYNFKEITVSGFRRKLSKDTIKSASDAFKGLKEALKIVKDFRPDMIIGTGGYVCGPMVLAGKLKGVKTAIHEQNAYPGVTNRILSRMVDRLYLSYEESKKYFKNVNRSIMTGNPVRDEFVKMDKSKARKQLNIKDDEKLILSFGGSGGALKINQCAMDLIRKIQGDLDLKFIHVTGKRYYNDFIAELENSDICLKGNVSVEKYLDNMPVVMGACDLVIGRAGALTLAEINALGLPSILIPTPNVAGNHQFMNASVVSGAGAGILIEEKNLDESFSQLVMELIKDDKKLKAMGIKSKYMAFLDSADVIANDVKKLISK
jgi:UDP-N-acetylglucosamine--N-acetylmuramyl-(pentapeptide) pyrophosphoryl-undecaprenol N-acetylglucosamine transferase